MVGQNLTWQIHPAPRPQHTQGELGPVPGAHTGPQTPLNSVLWYRCPSAEMGTGGGMCGDDSVAPDDHGQQLVTRVPEAVLPRGS